jgi:ubiquinol-cytochrome c reductase cytochrome b subunit
MKRLLVWFDDRLPLRSMWEKHASGYYVPKNLNLLYLFGVLALIILANQLITGLWLTMFYTPTSEGAFDSIEYIMRDVNYGWLLRYLHTTGASAFFVVLYIHLYRGLLYGSYKKPRELVWLIGMILFLSLLAEAFCGYLLPWGQLSYWGAQVITSVVGAIPYVGDSLVSWLRGDYYVSGVTLQRFFALHVIAIPLLLLFMVWLHIIALHQVGSNNPEGIEINDRLGHDGKPLDGVALHPFYTMKDIIGIFVFLIIFFAVVFFLPEMGGYFIDASNIVPANPLVTPTSIAPLWYMTPFYTILRIIPNKLTGIIAFISAILMLFLLPFLDKSPVRSMRYKGIWSRIALLLLVSSFLTLGYLGTVELTPMKQYLARIGVIIYFAYFILMPIYTRLERHLIPPMRIR